MTNPIIKVEPLGSPWQTIDPFLLCAHHVDHYPAGNSDLGPVVAASTSAQGWRMYFGKTVPGFPAHPHRGFETITIMRQGVVDHSDSLGASARFGAGDVQWLTAGRGIVHAEMFPLLNPDGPNTAEVIQIWLNLPAKKKMADPKFTMFWEPQVPRAEFVSRTGRTEVTCIVGALNGQDGRKVPPPPPPDSWAADPKSDMAVWAVKMSPNATWTLPAASGRHTRRQLFFYSGSAVSVGGFRVETGSAVELDCSAPLELVNGSLESNFLLLQGRPLDEPVVQHGPFVMNTLDEIRDAYADYRSTRFGTWPWPAPDPNHGPSRGRFAMFEATTPRPQPPVHKHSNRSENGELLMSIEENVQVVKDFFAATGSGDRRRLLSLCAEDIEWIVPGESWALAGTHRGHAGLEGLLQKASGLETSFPEPPEFVAQGDRVLMTGLARGKVKATNRPFEDYFVFAMTVRNGKVTNIREYVDTQALARACEPRVSDERARW
jgi:redox-sensitive bicupin YhaK (pirin superfamily)/ketosteroid isomerase-like protein